VPLSVLEEESSIFGKDSEKPLTRCQMEINETAFAVRNEDVSLLKRRNEPFDKAKLKIDQEGFQYKKGSRPDQKSLVRKQLMTHKIR